MNRKNVVQPPGLRDLRAEHRAHVLRLIERGPMKSSDVRDDLAARCGSKESVKIAIRGVVHLGHATGAGHGVHHVLTITEAGREELRARAEQRPEGRAA